MALNLYRRHRVMCEGGHAEDSCSGELEERRKGWKQCHCYIHLSGTIGGRFRRRSTEKTTWEDALAYATVLEAAGGWNGDAPKAPAPAPPVEPSSPRADATAPTASARVTIADAIDLYKTMKRATVAPATFRKHRTFTKQLVAFASARGFVCLDEFTRISIDVYYATSALGPRSKAKRLEALRGFFRFCVNREWLTKSPVSPDLKPPRGSTRPVNKMPFTDEQLADIIEACDQLEGRRWGNRHGAGEWTGQDVQEFIWVMVHTGLRISDVALFDITRLYDNEVFLHAKKNGGDAFAYIPDWLCDRLNARAARCGTKLFLTGRSPRIATHTEAWRKRISQVFALVDLGREKATPHRFRHTFGGSSCRRASRSPTWPIWSAMTRRQCAGTTRAGYRNGKRGSRTFSRTRAPVPLTVRFRYQSRVNGLRDRRRDRVPPTATSATGVPMKRVMFATNRHLQQRVWRMPAP